MAPKRLLKVLPDSHVEWVRLILLLAALGALAMGLWLLKGSTNDLSDVTKRQDALIQRLEKQNARITEEANVSCMRSQRIVEQANNAVDFQQTLNTLIQSVLAQGAISQEEAGNQERAKELRGQAEAFALIASRLEKIDPVTFKGRGAS